MRGGGEEGEGERRRREGGAGLRARGWAALAPLPLRPPASSAARPPPETALSSPPAPASALQHPRPSLQHRPLPSSTAARPSSAILYPPAPPPAFQHPPPAPFAPPHLHGPDVLWAPGHGDLSYGEEGPAKGDLAAPHAQHLTRVHSVVDAQPHPHQRRRGPPRLVLPAGWSAGAGGRCQGAGSEGPRGLIACGGPAVGWETPWVLAARGPQQPPLLLPARPSRAPAPPPHPHAAAARSPVRQAELRGRAAAPHAHRQ